MKPNTDPTNLVNPGSECPGCGERNVDKLLWLDDNRVQCYTCRRVYKPTETHRAYLREHGVG